MHDPGHRLCELGRGFVAALLGQPRVAGEIEETDGRGGAPAGYRRQPHYGHHVDGEDKEMTLRATQVYRREEGEWKIIHRHGDVLTPVEVTW